MPKIRDAQTGALRNATDLDETRIRFNWGYHDGASDCHDNRNRIDRLNQYNITERHFDPAYAEGYRQGWQDEKDGCYRGTSELAWNANRHRATLTPKYAPYRKLASR
jgi:hypothetical protein